MKTLLSSTALAALIALPVAAQTATETPAAPAEAASQLAVYDLNEDGVIDSADLILADTNGDGVVDANDTPQMATSDPLAPSTGGEAAGSDTADTELAPTDPLAPPADSDVAGTETPVAPEAEGGTDTDVAAGTETPAAPMAPEAGAGVDGQTDLAADITGERVYDANDEWIGEVSEIVVQDGKSWAIIDVGGFLGIGEKPVALDISELDIAPEGEDPANVKVSVNKTKAELEAMPTYEKM